MPEYAIPVGHHRHHCEKCGYVWEHSDENAKNIMMHKCAICGGFVTWRYIGEKTPGLYPPSFWTRLKRWLQRLL